MPTGSSSTSPAPARTYEAGDCVEILPQNAPELIDQMLTVLGVDCAAPNLVDFRASPGDGRDWVHHVSAHYGEAALRAHLPLAAALKIAHLRPLNPAVLARLIAVLGIGTPPPMVAAEIAAGKVHDVPTLLQLLFDCGVELDTARFVRRLCAALPPLPPRRYSISSAPRVEPGGRYPATVSVVASRLWYVADRVEVDKPAPAVPVFPGRGQASAGRKIQRQQSRRRSMFDPLAPAPPTRAVSAQPACRPAAHKHALTAHTGVCTSFLLEHSAHKYVLLRPVPSRSFRLPPAAASEAIMMVALGSGVAPMFAFLEELLRRGPGACPEVLMCWGLAKPENMFGHELLARAVEEIGLKLLVSFSRADNALRVWTDPLGKCRLDVVPGARLRVTTALARGSWPATVSRLAKAGAATFYLCGHPALSTTFQSAVESALCTAGLLAPDEAAASYAKIAVDGRVRADLYFSGQIKGDGLPAVSAAGLSRHHDVDDLWWSHRGLVYDGTHYAKLHPGGLKLLFDKAGRDATVDFEVAHGHLNLRVESAMAPFRVARLVKPATAGVGGSEFAAYGHLATYLDLVWEIRNVFYLDVNVFAGEVEATSSAHSPAMQFKAHEKFLADVAGALEAATAGLFADDLAGLPARSTVRAAVHKLGAAVLLPTVRALRTALAELRASGHPGRQMYLSAELCELEKDFLTAFATVVTEFVAGVERLLNASAEDNEGVETETDNAVATACASIASLPTLCEATVTGLRRRLEAASALPPDEAAAAAAAIAPRLRGGLELVEPSAVAELAVRLEYRAGDLVFRRDCVHDLALHVLSGELALEDDGLVLEQYEAGATLGVASPRNETMAHRLRVTSSVAVLAAVSTHELRRHAYSSDTPANPAARGRPRLSVRWRRALSYAKVSAAIRLNINTNRIRSTSLLGFISRQTCTKLAAASKEVDFAAGAPICEASEPTRRLN